MTSGLEPMAQEEIIRIFDCLSDARKIALFDEWDSLISRIKLRHEKLQEERTVLMLDPLSAIAKGYHTLVSDMQSYRTNYANTNI